jgi:hypothetical protein
MDLSNACIFFKCAFLWYAETNEGWYFLPLFKPLSNSVCCNKKHELINSNPKMSLGMSLHLLVRGALSLEVNRPKREADYSPPCSDEVNAWILPPFLLTSCDRIKEALLLSLDLHCHRSMKRVVRFPLYRRAACRSECSSNGRSWYEFRRLYNYLQWGFRGYRDGIF